ncbi:hypothetical protein TNIN_431991 [Trichonephila inaurata madagascariensis]|uniref:Uncharacterized protein n=1 Tax=Trichonephila inaurata madagascariensis TaxID=2747483 RepID=A0A8X7C9V4_9ARAC|nr:hypothetical protein TNIN_431991 [Trichonephila inaurata madagascariensis]
MLFAPKLLERIPFRFFITKHHFRQNHIRGMAERAFGGTVVLRRRRTLGSRPVPGLQQAHPSRGGDESDGGSGVWTLIHPAHQRYINLNAIGPEVCDHDHWNSVTLPSASDFILSCSEEMLIREISINSNGEEAINFESFMIAI